jgi:pilus assembly protein CpaC
MTRPVLASLVLVALAATLAMAQPAAPRELNLISGKSLVLDSPAEIVRASVADPAVVEAVGVSPTEVLLNGRNPGQTSVILWQKSGNRLFFDVTVRPRPQGEDKRAEILRRELEKVLAGQQIEFALEGDTVYLHGAAASLADAERAAAIAGSLLGKDARVVNLLQVAVPETDPQVLLKVRFAEVDRSAAQDLGANFISTGAGNTFGSVTTGQFTPPRFTGNVESGNFTLSDALNVFLFRPDIDLAATIRALQQKKMIEILAEPNVLAANGKDASFLAGGEFPYPVVQGGGVGGNVFVTIQFREFGIRLGFTPYLTSRGSIKLRVEPEVSALDFANGLLFQGFNIPALTVRRVSTEIELEDRQAFAIAGLLDNRLTETVTKIPGLGDIPILGALFRSRSMNKSKTELLVLVTPEIVQPLPQGQKAPDVSFTGRFLKDGAAEPPRTPGVEATGKPEPQKKMVPVEVLREEQRLEKEREEKRRTTAGSSMGFTTRGQ